jgi:hypothetical protein
MKKIVLAQLVELYEKKDKMLAEINRSTWDDPFTGEPECRAKHRIGLVEKLRDIEKEISTLKGTPS